MQNPNSIAACLRQARENARSIRESIPPELWEELNKFYHIIRGTDPEHVAEDPCPLLELVKTSSQLLIGIIDGCMSRGESIISEAPSCEQATAKETRVRVDDFRKIRPIASWMSSWRKLAGWTSWSTMPATRWSDPAWRTARHHFGGKRWISMSHPPSSSLAARFHI